jgi:hypothetical protein
MHCFKKELRRERSIKKLNLKCELSNMNRKQNAFLRDMYVGTYIQISQPCDVGADILTSFN